MLDCWFAGMNAKQQCKKTISQEGTTQDKEVNKSDLGDHQENSSTAELFFGSLKVLTCKTWGITPNESTMEHMIVKSYKI